MSDVDIKHEILIGKTLSFVATPNAPSFYTNIALVSIGPEEMAIKFGLTNPDNLNEATEIVRIYMSPGHAKRFLMAMQQNIARHESMFGNIVQDPLENLTPEMRKQLGIPDNDK